MPVRIVGMIGVTPPANDATRCCHFLSDGSSTASVHAGFGIGATSLDITSTYDFRQRDTDGLRTLPGMTSDNGNIIVTSVRTATTAPFTNVRGKIGRAHV